MVGLRDLLLVVAWLSAAGIPVWIVGHAIDPTICLFDGCELLASYLMMELVAAYLWLGCGALSDSRPARRRAFRWLVAWWVAGSVLAAWMYGLAEVNRLGRYQWGGFLASVAILCAPLAPVAVGLLLSTMVRHILPMPLVLGRSRSTRARGGNGPYLGRAHVCGAAIWATVAATYYLACTGPLLEIAELWIDSWRLPNYAEATGVCGAAAAGIGWLLDRTNGIRALVRRAMRRWCVFVEAIVALAMLPVLAMDPTASRDMKWILATGAYFLSPLIPLTIGSTGTRLMRQWWDRKSGSSTTM